MYRARITRLNPAAFIILIDQSGSMEEVVSFNSTPMAKAEAVALAANMLIGELINRSQRDDGVRDYFDIAVIGYHGDSAHSLLGPGGTFVRPGTLAMKELRKKKYTRERVLPGGRSVMTTMEHKQWIEPVAEGSTPMYDALRQAYELAERWCRKSANRSSYPPTIFNITDGEASDGDDGQLLCMAQKIRDLSTGDGNALLLNMHLSVHGEGRSVIFPSSADEVGGSRYARLLFEMSSPMPERYDRDIARIRESQTEPPYRGMSYNTTVTDVVAMMNIGSISANLTQ